MRKVTGTREAIEAELLNVADGCLGSDRFLARVERALAQIRSGADRVTVGHSVYVIDDSPSQAIPADVQSES